MFYMCTLRVYISNFVFCIFVKNSKIEYYPQFWGGENFWKIGESSLARYPEGRNFDEITLSRMVKEIQAVLCFTR